MGGEDSPVKSPGQLDGYWLPVDDWTQLQGRQVEIYRRGSVLDTGRVETVTHDGSILWLAQNGAATRRLVLKQDGVCVKLHCPGRFSGE